MANELNAGIGETGLTVTAQLYIAGAASGAPISCPEIGATGVYTGTMAGAAGTYGVAFLASSVIRAYGSIVWDGSNEVNLETAIPELSQGIPAATPTMRTGLMLLYMALRNRLDVDTTNNFKEVHNDAGTVICKKALTDDGAVYSEAEMVSGP